MILTLTDPQVDQVMNALAAQPYRESAPLIGELVKQIQQHQRMQMAEQQSQGAALQGGGALNGAGAAEQRSQ